jgi:hypothetical protein
MRNLIVTIAIVAAVPAGALAAGQQAHLGRSCGVIRPAAHRYLLPRHNVAHVTTRGPVSCYTARSVMYSLFRRGGNTRTFIRGWSCVGPQTGYAHCTKRRPWRSITATF